MKKNYISSQNCKTGLVVLLFIFCGLFSNKVAGQAAVAANDTFIWNGSISSDWATTANWTILRGTTTAGNNTYPGEVGTNDLVYINKNDTPFAAILDGQVIDVWRFYVANTFGTESGAVFTINAGAILNVGNNTAQSNNVFLNGGSIVNNGTLNIKAIGVGFSGFPSIGINCGNPNILPAVPREYGYSGTGTLTIDMPLANFAGAAAIAVLGNSGSTLTPTNNTNVTYKFVLNNPEITFNQATLLGIGAIRGGGGNNANKLIIGGTGLTIGTIGTPSIGSLLSLGGGSSVTIEAGTTLTLNSAITNLNSAIGGFSGSNFAADFTNKGTINILGASARSGMAFSTQLPNPNTLGVSRIYNINNEGTLNIDLNIASSGQGGLAITNGGGASNSAGLSSVNLNNKGTMTLKNTSTAAGSGFPIFTFTAGEAATLFITNSGTLNLEGSTYAYGLKTTVNNTGILNSNSEFRGFTAVNNNLGGSINFVRTAATATTRQANFTITTDTDTSGSVGNVYRDANNNDFTVVAQKYSGGFGLVTNALPGVVIPPTGTLTRFSFVGATASGSATIAYTAVGLSPLNGAISGNAANSGTINTDTASNLNIVSLLSTTASSVLSPGGDTGKGILTIPTLPSAAGFSLTLNGTLKIQASGSATAGVDYDAMQMTGADDFIDISTATLDVTGLYTPAVFTAIDIITSGANGGVVGNFVSVVGLPAKWAVVSLGGLGSKVQLVYDPSLGTDKFAEAQLSYYPNPTRNELNLTAAKNISKVELFNLLGQRVLSNSIDATQKQLDLSTIQNGVYLMEVTIDNAKQAFKIVKQ